MKKKFKLISAGSFFTIITAAVLCFSGCAEKSTNLSLKEDRVVKVDTSTYNAYEGKYELAPNFIITVTKKGDSLFAQATGQGAAEIFSESKDKFSYKVVAAKIQFNRNADGEVESLTLFQNGQEMHAKKLNSRI